MIQENELLTLLLATGLWLFYFLNRLSVSSLPGWRFFLLANVFLTTGWILTILEGFFWPDILNLIEHSVYTVSSMIFAVWCWRVFSGRNRAAQ